MAREQLAVIFDVDGVLVDSYRAHLASWRRMAGEYGVEITERQFAATFGKTSREIIAHFWGETSDERIAEMDGRKEEIYRQRIADDFPAMDGARELVRSLDQTGWKLAVGSSGPPENVRASLAGLDLPECFDAAVNGMDVTRGKPDPQVFLLAAERLGVPPERCAVIEDAPAGVEAARRAGMTPIALTGTASADKLADADLVVDSLRELTPGKIADVIAARAARPPSGRRSDDR